MKICIECRRTEEEIGFIDESRRGGDRCAECLDNDPDYWREKYFLLEKSLGHYIRSLEETDLCLINLTEKTEEYINGASSTGIAGEGLCAVLPKAKKRIKINALGKLTRLSEDLGFYRFEHPNFYQKK